MISQNLRNRVIDKVRESKSIAIEKLKIDLPPIQIEFNLKGWCAGVASHSDDFSRASIKFNEYYLNKHEDSMITNAVPHEVAHIVANKYYKMQCNHGRLWQTIMVDVYHLPPEKYHDFGKPDNARKVKRYKFTCEHCQYVMVGSQRTINRMKIVGIQRWHCTRCQKSFSENTRIVLDIR